jgi:hypothetical protein
MSTGLGDDEECSKRQDKKAAIERGIVRLSLVRARMPVYDQNLSLQAAMSSSKDETFDLLLVRDLVSPCCGLRVQGRISPPQDPHIPLQ